MAKKRVINLKNITKLSMACTLILATVVAISAQTNYIAINMWSTLAYVIISLVFTVSIFMLCIRHYKITSEHDLVMRIVAIIGAVFCCGVWVLLVYPITILIE